ncbi:toxin Cry1Ac domain D-VI-related protein [Brevibacillus porteri]|uniref:Pesticidal crystal protein Cry1Aa domain-containing protein n=1 Tax=Brevibacillus porteri TaxID=2126350 RepID=A0ABX5FLU3_9BACL|nr:toxin Cry1Ac domain D-VI-related protein [Brevibacillus porteri]MED1802741.1 toxin Cry1Ac domain D-VI-related protein [Brevibacillus porteri]MED2131657.1 toxin Cry1Ac domain D-VI-related protein [Brevibacillus porteri]MED2746107.1 toxin Cry1Ac domain D-VI-related protein [Brevibacillus porteri]MED2817140.1 toxin Cry1Ac domain D-VI-related protein [Brevibacillus porteri]MED2892314.1 toxin Cry1Ac domain D-VI-related protein [Brevibacillus porteri]
MSKKQPKAKIILTAVVSTGFLLSFVGNAYAAVSYPIKERQTIGIASPSVAEDQTDEEVREASEEVGEDENQSGESLLESEEHTATNGFIAYRLETAPDKALVAKDFRLTAAIDDRDPTRIKIKNFVWLEEEQLVLLSFSPIRAAKKEQTVSLRLQYDGEEEELEPFVIAERGTKAERIELVAVAEDARLSTKDHTDKSLTLIAVAFDENDRIVTGRELFWSSSNRRIAFVNFEGKVTAKKEGLVEITAKMDEAEAVFEIAVDGAELPDLPALSVSEAVIEEAGANDGSITAKQTLKLSNGKFLGELSANDIEVHNLPDGLDIESKQESDDELTILFTGQARKHTGADNVKEVSFTIDKRNIKRAQEDVTSDSFSIRFKDPVIVIPSPIDPPPIPALLKAKRAVEELFTDGKKEELRPGTTQKQIDDAKKLVEGLDNRVSEKPGLLADIEKAQEQYDDLLLVEAKKAVRDLFTDENQTGLKPGVTQSTIDAAKEKVEKLKDGSETKVLLLADIQKAQTLLDNGKDLLKEAKQAVEGLYTNNDMVELRPKVTQEMIDAAFAKVELLSEGPEKTHWMSYISKAHLLFNNPRIDRLPDAEIELPIAPTQSRQVTIADKWEPAMDKRALSEYLEVSVKNQPLSYRYDNQLDRFVINEKEYITVEVDESMLEMTHGDYGVTIKAKPTVIEDDNSYAVFKLYRGENLLDTEEISVGFDATPPQLSPDVTCEGTTYTLSASEPLRNDPNPNLRMLFSPSGNFDDKREVTAYAKFQVSGNTIRVTFQDSFYTTYGSLITEQSKVSFEPGFMRDKAGNLIQGTATAPVKPKQ